MRYDNNPVLSGISYFAGTALMLLFIRKFSTALAQAHALQTAALDPARTIRERFRGKNSSERV
jgi:hypothetical protein